MDAHPLYDDRTLPLLAVTEGAGGTDAEAAAAWAAMHRDAIEAHVTRAGVLLIRGFQINTPSRFRKVCAAIRPDLQNYTGGDSPRDGVDEQVYTSSEYPAHLEVLLHNELAYAGWSPDRVFFGCMIPSETGGETHIADGREVCAKLDPEVRDRFETRGVTYLQHLWDADGEPGIGKSWQETFETRDRATAEAYLRKSDMAFEWTDFGLRTAATHAAILEHAMTGEKCWHNQADQWHRGMETVKVSFGGKADARIDPATAGVETLGNHATFADGGEIGLDDLEHVRSVMRSCEVLFPWQAGDVMVIDNVLAMHGRKPFTGGRRVLVAMA